MLRVNTKQDLNSWYRKHGKRGEEITHKENEERKCYCICKQTISQ
jgi:hypothetical protein